MLWRTQNKRPIWRILSQSALSQSISSGANFALGVYLVRTLDAVDFGLYGIGFSLSLLIGGIASSLLVTQVIIHVPEKTADDQLPYAGRMFKALLAVSVLAVVLACGIALLCRSFSAQSSEFGLFLTCSIAAAAAFTLKDFLVRHAYTAKKPAQPVWINSATAIALAVFVGGAALNVFPLTPQSALLIYALSNCIGAMMGYALSELPLGSVRLTDSWIDCKDAWSSGKWALVGVVVAWIQTQGYVYVTALTLGPVGVAAANATRLLITPAYMLLPAFTQIIMPRLAAQRVENEFGMYRSAKKLTVWLVFIACAYSMILIGSMNVIADAVLGSRYSDLELLVAAWCVVLICSYSRACSALALQVSKMFKRLTMLNSLSVAISLGAAMLLSRWMGAAGAVLSTAIGELILSALLLVSISKVISLKQAEQSAVKV